MAAEEKNVRRATVIDKEPDATGGYWSNRPENTLPPPDMMGAYMRNRPVAPEGVATRKAWISAPASPAWPPRSTSSAMAACPQATSP